jgi:hypothetical protein
MSKEEGFTKAVKNLQQVIIKDALSEMRWV